MADGPEIFSPLFPWVWLSLPLFFLCCGVIRLIEGERQSFNYAEALGTAFGSCILGSLWSSGYVMQFFLDPAKHELSAFEAVWKAIFVVLTMDCLFYWIHRALHEIPFLRRFHAHHHKRMASHTCWGGLDEDLSETMLIFGWLNAPFLFVSVTPGFVLAYVLAGSCQTALMHGTKDYGFPPRPLVDTAFHFQHHANPTKNYGGALVLWDAVMGTQAAAAPRPRGRLEQRRSTNQHHRSPSKKKEC